MEYRLNLHILAFKYLSYSRELCKKEHFTLMSTLYICLNISIFPDLILQARN